MLIVLLIVVLHVYVYMCRLESKSSHLTETDEEEEMERKSSRLGRHSKHATLPMPVKNVDVRKPSKSTAYCQCLASPPHLTARLARVEEERLLLSRFTKAVNTVATTHQSKWSTLVDSIHELEVLCWDTGCCDSSHPLKQAMIRQPLVQSCLTKTKWKKELKSLRFAMEEVLNTLRSSLFTEACSLMVNNCVLCQDVFAHPILTLSPVCSVRSALCSLLSVCSAWCLCIAAVNWDFRLL